jgi:putative Mg2+ transporter-C (MgtC) family protein
MLTSLTIPAADLGRGLGSFLELDPGQLASEFLRLAVAFVLALPIAWNREKETRSAGLRTFPLVALASCGFVLLGRGAYGDDPGAQARVMEGVITGIGFIGGGAIMKHSNTVVGTATASSIWATGAMGAAVAYDRLEIAVVLSFACYAVLRWLKLFKTSDTDQLT